jgi:hypothetical protein
MRRSITVLAVLIAALAAAFAAPASGTVTPDADSNLDTWSSIPQWVAPWPVANDDKAFTLQPNTTQTFVTPMPQIQAGSWHVLVPCWGYDIQGPGVDMAVGGVETYGPLGGPDYDFHGTPHPNAVQDAAGNWSIPETVAQTITPWQLKDGALCRKIGWSFYVGNPAVVGGAVAVAARKAKHIHRDVRVRPRKPKGRYARAANVGNDDGSVTVEMAGLHLIGAPTTGLELVVRVRTGNLAGPTTLFTHARVLLQEG